MPQEVPGSLLDEFLRTMSSTMVATRSMKFLRTFISRRVGRKPGFLDLMSALTSKTKGRTNEAFSNWTWGVRFCPVAREEWMTFPLDEEQEFHLAYYMDLIESTIRLIGLKNIAVCK